MLTEALTDSRDTNWGDMLSDHIQAVALFVYDRAYGDTRWP